MKRVYLSGKITGLAEDVYMHRFKQAELKLKQLGYIVINPAKKGEIPGYKWTDYMKEDLKLLMDCDFIYMIPGWEDSKGAVLEHSLSQTLGIPVLKVMGEK